MDLTKKQKKIIIDLGYKSPAQFLFHFPNRYEVSENKDYSDWEINDQISFEAQLASPFRHVRFARNRSVTNFNVLYQNHEIKVSIFNRTFLKESQFKNGLVIVGKVDKPGQIVAQQILQPRPLNDEMIKPIYSTKKHITQYEITRLMKKILEHVKLKDVVPDDIQSKRNLLKRNESIETLHLPKNKKQLEKALYSIKFEEFLMYHLKGEYQNRKMRQGIERNVNKSEEIKNLPFTLRDDQYEAYSQILSDMNSSKKMKRLLQGDVGSGKTVVAFLAALSLIEQGYQVAFMVPTELLLFQHVESFKKLFPKQSYLILNQDSSKDDYSLIETGQRAMVFGTHSLFQDKAVFKNLGLAIIDEQHRFGVKQRESLFDKGDFTEQLMLSATPIPQTLAQSIFLDLDVSTLKHSRQDKVETHLIPENSIRSIIDDLKTTLANNQQIYVVCPAIEQGEKENVRNVDDIYKNLRKVFEHSKVAMLHGKMDGSEKERILTEFSLGDIDILISTSVIEVGIDVHNANSIVIYNSEQFGLATLHQMRGRVGRGDYKGQCYILSSNTTESTKKRLSALVEYDDGFILSKIDLKQRGMGDLLGERQSGLPQFFLADVFEDVRILEESKVDADYLIDRLDEYPILNQHIIKLSKDREENGS